MKAVRLVLILWVLPVALAGCDLRSRQAPAHDFDELIPRLMNALDRPTPEEAASNLFNVTSPDERRDAIAFLQTRPWGHEAPYMKAYLLLATDPHPMVKAQAMRALGSSHQPDEVVPALIKGLNDPHMQVRRDAAIALRSTWNESAIGPLVQHLKDDTDTLVRGYCARALAQARTSESIRALIDALGDTDAAVCKFALDSLVTATGQSFGYDLRAWLAWYQQTYAIPPGGVNAPTLPG